jgi:hypothetical protein
MMRLKNEIDKRNRAQSAREKKEFGKYFPDLGHSFQIWCAPLNKDVKKVDQASGGREPPGSSAWRQSLKVEKDRPHAKAQRRKGMFHDGRSEWPYFASGSRTRS